MQYISYSPLASPAGILTVTVPRPPIYSAGDLLLACLSSDYESLGTSPGWTAAIRFVRTGPQGGCDLAGGIYWRVATAKEPASYPWSLLGANTRHGFANATVIAIRGQLPTKPILSAAKNPQKPNKTTMSAPSVPGIAGGVLVCLWVHDDPQTPLAPASMRQLTRFAAHGDGHAVAFETLTANGPTGVRTAKLDPRIGGGGGNMSFSVVLQ